MRMSVRLCCLSRGRIKAWDGKFKPMRVRGDVVDEGRPRRLRSCVLFAVYVIA